jgi:hypothetical protein
MQKITEFKMIPFNANFDKLVNAAIKEGWQPYGTPLAYQQGYYAMGMVKYENVTHPTQFRH